MWSWQLVGGGGQSHCQELGSNRGPKRRGGGEEDREVEEEMEAEMESSDREAP